MSVLITISAPTYEELQWRKQQMSDLMKSMDIQVGDCLFQQEAALRSTMPFLYLDPGLERKSKRNVLTSGAASTYMFTSFELSDDNGILLGLNRHRCVLSIHLIQKSIRMPILLSAGHLAPVRPLPCR